MATQTPSIQSFVPAQLLRWLADRPMHDEPASRTQEMAVLFADLSDFSSLTLDITERQRAGPEKVTELLDSTFSTIVETIGRYGGEVLGFAGDSVLATWTLGESLAKSDAVALASSCGLEVQGLTLPAAERPLRLRIGIGVGPGVLVRV